MNLKFLTKQIINRSLTDELSPAEEEQLQTDLILFDILEEAQQIFDDAFSQINTIPEAKELKEQLAVVLCKIMIN